MMVMMMASTPSLKASSRFVFMGAAYLSPTDTVSAWGSACALCAYPLRPNAAPTPGTAARP